MNSTPDRQLFDSYADDYESALKQGISISGEGRDYFARGRIEWLARRLRERGVKVGLVLDFGCGTGDAAPHFLSLLNAASVIGIDVSRQSLEFARGRYGSDRVRFVQAEEFQPAANVDLVFCNGVFHHIPPAVRSEKVRWVFDCLKPGGLFAFWDNNPWNLGARLVMKRIPFDREAVMLSAIAAVKLLQGEGFSLVRTDHLFIFPSWLRKMRSLEPFLSRMPLGAQYMVLAKK